MFVYSKSWLLAIEDENGRGVYAPTTTNPASSTPAPAPVVLPPLEKPPIAKPTGPRTRFIPEVRNYYPDYNDIKAAPGQIGVQFDCGDHTIRVVESDNFPNTEVGFWVNEVEDSTFDFTKDRSIAFADKLGPGYKQLTKTHKPLANAKGEANKAVFIHSRANWNHKELLYGVVNLLDTKNPADAYVHTLSLVFKTITDMRAADQVQPQQTWEVFMYLFGRPSNSDINTKLYRQDLGDMTDTPQAFISMRSAQKRLEFVAHRNVRLLVACLYNRYFLARVGTSLRVTIVEPDPRLAALLKSVIPIEVQRVQLAHILDLQTQPIPAPAVKFDIKHAASAAIPPPVEVKQEDLQSASKGIPLSFVKEEEEEDEDEEEEQSSQPRIEEPDDTSSELQPPPVSLNSSSSSSASSSSAEKQVTTTRKNASRPARNPLAHLFSRLPGVSLAMTPFFLISMGSQAATVTRQFAMVPLQLARRVLFSSPLPVNDVGDLSLNWSLIGFKLFMSLQFDAFLFATAYAMWVEVTEKGRPITQAQLYLVEAALTEVVMASARIMTAGSQQMMYTGISGAAGVAGAGIGIAAGGIAGVVRSGITAASALAGGLFGVGTGRPSLPPA